MSERVCPLCFEPLPSPLPAFCPECAAPTAMAGGVEGSSSKENKKDRKHSTEEEAAGSDEIGDLLIRQFSDYDVPVPRQWSERLRALAKEAEPGRRYATMIFVDISGYTQIARLLPESRIKELRTWFFTLCSKSIERHGGFLIQLLGDGVFAAFGAPWAFERDAEAGIECLLEIREAVRRKGSFDGHGLHIHAGAANGVINVDMVEEGGRRRPDLFGTAVNLASKLQQHAEPDCILIPQPLGEFVIYKFSLRKREEEADPVGGESVFFEVEGRLESPGERRPADAPFIGREPELSYLREAIQSLRPAAPFRAIRITGEAGIGKTRLIEELLADLGPDAPRSVSIRLEPFHQSMMLHAAAALVRAVAKEAPEADASAYRDAVGFVLGDEASRRRVKQLPPGLLKSTVVESITSFLAKALPRAAPVVFLDDAQWCDPFSGGVLRKLRKTSPRGVVLIIAGRRQEDDGETHFFLNGGGQREENPLWQEGWEELELGALESRHAEALLVELLGKNSSHPAIYKRLMEESEGVPLFLTELGRLAGDYGEPDLAAFAEMVEKEHTLDSMTLLIEVLQARFDRLTSYQRLILQAGAVLGRRFRESLISGWSDAQERLMEELAILKGMRMLRDQALPDDREYEFVPALLRDAAYGMLTEEQRRHLHEVFAEMIERKFASRVEEVAAELVHHWLRAKRLDRARPWVRRVARSALRSGFPAQAYHLTAEAIRLSDEEIAKDSGARPGGLASMQHALLHEEAGRAARSLGDYSASLAHLREWRRLAEEGGNEIWIAMAQHQIAITCFESGRNQESEELLEELLSRDGLIEFLRPKVLSTYGHLLVRRGNYQRAIGVYKQSADDSRGQAPSVAGDAMASAALCYQRLGKPELGLEAAEEAAALYQRGGSAFGECVARNNRAILLERLGRYGEAKDTYRHALERATDCSYLHAMAAIEANLSFIAYLEEDAEAAARHAARSLNLAEMISHGNSVAIALINQGLAFSLSLQRSEARKNLDKAMSLLRDMDDRDMYIEASTEAAWLAMLDQDEKAAEGFLVDQGDIVSNEIAVYRQSLRCALGLETIERDELFCVQKLSAPSEEAPALTRIRQLRIGEWLAQQGKIDEAAQAFRTGRRKVLSRVGLK